MLVVLSDTHAETDPSLNRHLERVVGEADALLHAGDFTTPAVLDAFRARADTLVAVAGNRDGRAVTEQLPETTCFEWEGFRIALAHGHRHDRTSLSLFGRENAADAVVVGHTHRPGVDSLDDIPVVNPGSHADPRGARAGYAVFQRSGGRLRCELRTLTGKPGRTVRL
ncbi:metallophosphoesterase [Halovenus marina]|jgi:putative phosphoesterase|uniref:metallophosphoesterase n=1 Tax=Halovenus marina TaxID=3396621 RepID=UPI003F56445D